MNTEVQSEQALVNEALTILMDRMPPSKVARLLALLQIGSGDYAATRQKLFEGETVDSLYSKIIAQRQKETKA